ncbi:MAG TPA: DHH family phosphoesterase, partial [Gemmatimonadales bacterium]|nr:DHH family phosphoesterase [Gemmatimonadales bacterium]
MPPSSRDDAAAGRRVPVPAVRRRAARDLAAALLPGMRVLLTTHVNADGDGAGSEVALWHLLRGLGCHPVIANPTPYPERYRFLLAGAPEAEQSGRAVREIARADLILVLDISDLGRLGHLAAHIGARRAPVACVDHHQSNGSLPPGPRLVDPGAAATGELIYDLARSAGWNIPVDAARALYVALLSDTGGFRFSNTSPRALRVAADLLATGLDPEDIYAEVYAGVPEGRVRLLAESLDTLAVEVPPGLAWITVPAGALERHNVTSDELDGVVEFARSIAGVRLALLFRHLSGGKIKVSFRSVGDVDVARLAERFGGGG